ncbi:MAG TPA: hypothetical protein VF668_23185 [Pyrinomonadaceae bacterium]|jgi:hypothetical protein
MPERKDMAGKDDERQVRGRKGPSSQAPSERKRRPARKGGAAPTGAVPKEGKRDSSRGGSSGEGLH